MGFFQFLQCLLTEHARPSHFILISEHIRYSEHTQITSLMSFAGIMSFARKTIKNIARSSICDSKAALAGIRFRHKM